jgi:hypothetical protein
MIFPDQRGEFAVEDPYCWTSKQGGADSTSPVVYHCVLHRMDHGVWIANGFNGGHGENKAVGKFHAQYLTCRFTLI